jgi:uncharacterized oligopeptide transporter (OPT) family protein
MKEKWGESLAGNFSFGIVQLVLILCAGLVSVLIGSLIHPIAGIAVGVILAFLIFAVISAAQTVFTAAVYRNINGSLDEHFDQQLIDNLFEPKKKKSIF